MDNSLDPVNHGVMTASMMRARHCWEACAPHRSPDDASRLS
jgi:hypothetical protein